jgi:hypothetical protein
MSPMWSELSFITAILLMVLVMGTALLILWLILVGKIDLSLILSESDAKKASLSRFQFLLFTFVIAGLFLLLSIESGAFVNIPDSVLGLLGISAGSYAVSKGINSSDAKKTP